MNADSKNYNRIIIYTFLVVLIVYVMFNAMLYLSRVGLSEVTIEVIPKDATVKINGDITTNKKIFMDPGEYSFTASKKGWQDHNISAYLHKDKKLTVSLIPEPSSEDAEKFITDNPDIQQEREALGGKNFDSEYSVSGKNPLVNSLPYTDVYGPFKVDYGPSYLPNNKSGILLEINSSTPPGRVKFTEWLKQQGVDPTDFEIDYYDYNNPFKESDLL